MNDLARKLFPDKAALYDAGKCTDCGELRGEFRDALSRKESEISGMCQKCQDKFFGK